MSFFVQEVSLLYGEVSMFTELNDIASNGKKGEVKVIIISFGLQDCDLQYVIGSSYPDSTDSIQVGK